MAKKKSDEVWSVSVRSRKYENDHQVIKVRASSAGQAEKRALEIARVEHPDMTSPYVSSASFDSYVY